MNTVTPQKITKDIVEGMYRFVGLDYEEFFKAMREMGKLGLLVEGWTQHNPFKNNSYIVSETVYFFLAPKGSEPWKTALVDIQFPAEWQDKDKFQHWVKWPNNLIVDLALQHFETVDKVPDYVGKSKKFKFHKDKPTAKAIKLAQLAGLIDD